MSGTWLNPMPMGTQAAAGSTTDSTKLLMAQAYGRRGGMRSAAKRRKSRSTKRKRAKRSSGGKLKFGSAAYRAKYLGKKRRKGRRK